MRRNLIPSFEFEKQYWQRGYRFVVGMDEVGRGAFAGPLVAAAVVFTPEFSAFEHIRDSKLLSAKVREEQAVHIKEHALFYAIEEIPLLYINQFGVGKAGDFAFANLYRRVIDTLKHDVFALIDGFLISTVEKENQQAIIKGDQKSVSIAAASIIAKVYRDALMSSVSEQYARYNFVQNKGYGTADHRKAIKEYGLCDLHRTSFNLNKFL